MANFQEKNHPGLDFRTLLDATLQWFHQDTRSSSTPTTSSLSDRIHRLLTAPTQMEKALGNARNQGIEDRIFDTNMAMAGKSWKVPRIAKDDHVDSLGYKKSPT